MWPGLRVSWGGPVNIRWTKKAKNGLKGHQMWTQASPPALIGPPVSHFFFSRFDVGVESLKRLLCFSLWLQNMNECTPEGQRGKMLRHPTAFLSSDSKVSNRDQKESNLISASKYVYSNEGLDYISTTPPKINISTKNYNVKGSPENNDVTTVPLSSA